MNIALCYDQVFPARGGCGTYLTDLARSLVADRHEVHLYACTWEAAALPDAIHYHPLPAPHGPRFLRPWRFGAACDQAVRAGGHQVTIGFDKTWGQDVLYPQGGLHRASIEHNLHKYRRKIARRLARMAKCLDVAHWSFAALERRQYLGQQRPLIIVNSEMVRKHFQQHYQIDPTELRVVYSAIDPSRFAAPDRPRLRLEWRERWGIKAQETVALFAAMNYRLKGLEPLLHAVRRLPVDIPFCLLVAGSPRIQRYERLARRLGIAHRVNFLGPRRDMLHCYFAADFLVHPTFYDPCSLVVLEALACGLPVITSRFNGVSELLTRPQDSYVIDDPHDHARLAACMEELLDPARRNTCAQAARRSATRWTWEHHYRQLVQVFTEAAARKNAA
jgi:UDP-glucose:(heptosyl)LPS alpha-1,3-glucosyltransferase